MTAHQEPSPSSRGARWKRAGWWIFGSLLVLPVGSSLAASVALNNRLESDRKRGEPLSLAETLTRPREAPANAADR